MYRGINILSIFDVFNTLLKFIYTTIMTVIIFLKLLIEFQGKTFFFKIFCFLLKFIIILTLIFITFYFH